MSAGILNGLVTPPSGTAPDAPVPASPPTSILFETKAQGHSRGSGSAERNSTAPPNGGSVCHEGNILPGHRVLRVAQDFLSALRYRRDLHLSRHRHGAAHERRHPGGDVQRIGRESSDLHCQWPGRLSPLRRLRAGLAACLAGRSELAAGGGCRFAADLDRYIGRDVAGTLAADIGSDHPVVRAGCDPGRRPYRPSGHRRPHAPVPSDGSHHRPACASHTRTAQACAGGWPPRACRGRAATARGDP